MTTEFTNPIIEAIQIAEKDKLHFIENYIRIPSPGGAVIPFMLTAEQKETLSLLEEHRFVEKSVDRAWGKTLLAAALIVHDLVFVPHKLIVVMMQDIRLTSEMRTIIEFMIDHLPHAIKPVFAVHNKRHLKTESGAQVVFDGPLGNSLKGRSVDFFYVENLSRFSIRDQDNLRTCFYPVVRSGDRSRMLVLNS